MTAYAVLYILEINSVGPIVFRPAGGRIVSQHAVPTVSMNGVVAWLSVLLAHAVAVGALASARTRARQLAGMFIIFVFSAVYVAVIHPTLILTVLTSADRERVTAWMRGDAPAMYHYYFGSSDFRSAMLLLGAVHATLLSLIIVAARLARRRASVR
jgi:hypothetical protein